MTSWTIRKDFAFSASHQLAHLPAEHQCARLHGHSFRVQLVVRGPVDARLGWVQDFADLSEAWRPLHEQLDHRLLNEVPGLENPTSEHLARWIWERIKPALPLLARVVVHETCTSGCAYEGD